MHPEKIYPIISDQLPDYVQEEYDTFVKFVDYYYEYLDKEYQIKGEETDTVQANDLIPLFNTGKNFSDSVGTTDVFDKQSDFIRTDEQVITDTPAITTSTDFTESLTASDTFSTVTDFIRVYTDEQVITDTGYIVLLDYDYVDITYFSEDYVGDVRVF